LKTNVDYIGAKGGSGEIANLMAQQGRLNIGAMRPFVGKDNRTYMTIYKGGDVNKAESWITASAQSLGLQTNGTLRRDEWKQLDEALLEISRQRLGGVQDLVDNGLVFTLGNAMGTTVLEYHDVSDAMEADLTMDGITRSVGDRPTYGTNYLPIPIIHVDYEINARVLAASRSLGNPLDTTSMERAVRKVNEKLETMLFTNTTYAFGGGTIYSYVNHTDRNQVTLSTNWDASSKSAADILDDVISMKQASIDAMHYGPWMLYIPTAYETVLDQDYDTTTPGTTIRERILKISGIKGIKVIDTLTANNVLLVQMTSDVVRLVRGMGVTNVQWQEEGKFVTKYKVLTIQVPQIRSDKSGNCGITHLAA